MKKNVVLNTWAIFIYFFCQWLITVLITRMAGYEAAGQYSLAVSFANMFSFIAKYGVRGFQISDTSFRYSDLQYYVLRTISSAVAAAAFFVILFARNFGEKLQQCCIVVMIYKILEGIDDCIIGSMQRKEKYRWIAISYTLKGFIPVALCFFILILNHQMFVLSIIAMTIGYAVVQLIYDIPRAITLIKNKFVWNGMGTLITICTPLMLASFLDALLIYLPRDAIEKVLNEEMLGYYSTVSIIVVVFSTLGSGVWGGIIPAFSKWIQNRKWKKIYSETYKILITISGFSALSILLCQCFGKILFSFVFGKKIEPYLYILIPTMVNAIIMLFNSFFQSILIPMKKEKMLLLSNFFSVLLCFFLARPFVFRYGLLGACFSHMSGLLFRGVYLGFIYFRELHTRKRSDFCG